MNGGGGSGPGDPSDFNMEVDMQLENVYWQTTMGGTVENIQSRIFIVFGPAHPQVSTHNWIDGQICG